MATRQIGKPRGLVQASSPSSGVIDHQRVAPPSDLEHLIEHFWTVAWDCTTEPVTGEVLPHPSVHIVFEAGRSRVAGVPKGRFVRRLEGVGRVFGIKFLPGCFRPFLGASASTITGKEIAVEELFGEAVSGVERRLLEASEMSSMCSVAAEFIRRVLPAPDPSTGIATRVVRLALDDRSIGTVERLAEASGLGVRALQRVFREYVGVGPKWVIQRYRLHEALERVRTNPGADPAVEWAALALDLGYSDQSHFIRDFKTMVGRTPAEYQLVLRP